MLRLYLVLALFVLGCGDDGGDSAVTGGNGTLRSDIIEVFPPADANLVISDVDTDGDRIVLVTVQDLQYVSFIVSDDRGATWTAYALDDALATDIPWDANNVGVHLQGGKIFFLLSREYSPRTTEWGLYEVTLVPPSPPLGYTMTLSEITPSGLLVTMAFAQKRPDGHMRGLITYGGDTPAMLELDALTGQLTSDTAACTGRACNIRFWFSANRGDSFHGYSQAGPGVDVCRLRWSQSEPARQVCVKPWEWFAPSTTTNNHVVISDDEQPYVAWAQDGEAYAMGITDAGELTPVLPLGPGSLDNFTLGRMATPRFAEFEHIQPGEGLIDEGRLVRITSSGPEQVNFRETPCTDPHCGWYGAPNFGLSLVNWIEPTGRGDYYVFYVVQSDGTGGNRQALYMSPSETPTFTPIEASGPLPGPPTYTPPTDAALMTQVQQACVAIAACFNTGGPDQGIATCVRSLTTTDPYRPYLAAYRARLFAALPGGCAAIDAAQGNGAGTCSKACTLSGGTCPAGASTCSNLITLGAQQCNTCSDASTYLACNTSNTAYAVSCPTGTECNPTHGCVQTAFCDSNNATSCSGTDRTTCEAGTQIVRTEDCAGQGGTCAIAGCESTQVGAPCSELAYGTQCAGPYIKSCSLGKIVYADCRALGHASCVAEPLGGYGRCTD